MRFFSLLFLIYTILPEFPDFGPDGLGGLSAEEREKLVAEEIVIPQKPLILTDGKTVITAAVIIKQSLEKTWAILSHPEKQIEYLEELKHAKLLWRQGQEDRVYFEIEILGISLSYTVIHRFYPELKAISWSLDPEAKNDLKEFHGFWRLYPWKEKMTLARYGSQVSSKFRLAELIIRNLYKQRVKRSLLAVKGYLEKF